MAKDQTATVVVASEHYRDVLATDRTVLSNERTLLSYIRTALTMFISGATFIKFFDYPVLAFVGWVFIPLSLALMGVGVWSYRRTGRAIHRALCEEPREERGRS